MKTMTLLIASIVIKLITSSGLSGEVDQGAEVSKGDQMKEELQIEIEELEAKVAPSHGFHDPISGIWIRYHHHWPTE